METERVLVTGGAGFVGSHLVDSLLEKGFKVIVLDDFSSGNMNNIWHHLASRRFKLVKGSVLDERVVDEVVAKSNVIFHLAAQIHVDESIIEPKYTFEVNALGTLNVLEVARKHEIELVVLVSSCEVYGTAQYVPMDEGHPLNPSSPYAASKAAADRLAPVSYTHLTLPTN